MTLIGQGGRRIGILNIHFQLYNESGYDLLDPLHDIKQMEDLTKVTILEDGSG